jgi:cytochrome d ubiquinol oxidase subunit I
VGDIFGAPLAVEGILAFFMESTFVAVMYFGWKKVSPGFHLASTWLTGLGATISAWWILVANAWMQYPVGCTFNPDTMRHEMTSFFEVALSPFAIDKFCHTVISSWIIGAVFVTAVSCWYLLKKREQQLAVESLKIATVVGLIASLGAAATGHKSAQSVGEVQPMKLAAMEALYNGGTDQGLTAVAWVNPWAQPDYEHQQEPALKIEMPYALSFMATNDIHGYVPGINDILNGYTKADGTQEPSVEEKIERGKKAIEALAKYREAKFGSSDDGETAAANLEILKENMKYFGYGYIKDKNDVVPPVLINFWAFRVMVGIGCLFILFFAVILAVTYKFPKALFKKYDITTLPAWHYWIAILLIPLGYIGSESGWLVAEFGRQPWTIQDMLPTWAAVSDLQSSSVMITFFLFLILFTTMLAVEINILLKQIKKGPEV